MKSFSEDASRRLYAVSENSPTANEVLDLLKENADPCYTPNTTGNSTLHILIQKECVECVLKCFEYRIPIDFTVRGKCGVSILHQLVQVKSPTAYGSMFTALMDRVTNPRFTHDKIDWLQEYRGYCNIFSDAATKQRLHLLWEAVCDLPYFSEENLDRGIRIDTPVASEDWDALSAGDQARFLRGHANTNAASMDLYDASRLDTPSVAVVREVMTRMPNVCYKPYSFEYSAFYMFVEKKWWDCVLACLATPMPIDFMECDMMQAPILHKVLLEEDAEVCQRVLNSIAERLGDPRLSQDDVLDWTHTEFLTRWTVFSVAASHKRLHMLWSAVGKLPYFTAADTEPLPLGTPIAVEDWFALEEADQERFLLVRGLDLDPISVALLKESVSASPSLEKVRDLVAHKANVCYKGPGLNTSSLFNFLQNGRYEFVLACLESSVPIDFNILYDNHKLFLHELLSIVDVEACKTILHRVVERILSGSEDSGNWMEWDGYGRTLFSVAAANQRLHLLWNAVRRMDCFTDDEAPPIEVDDNVTVADWAALRPEDRERFVLRGDTSAASMDLYLESFSDTPCIEKVRGLVARDADVCLASVKDSQTTTLQRFVAKRRWDCVSACLESPVPIHFNAGGEPLLFFLFHRVGRTVNQENLLHVLTLILERLRRVKRRDAADEEAEEKRREEEQEEGEEEEDQANEEENEAYEDEDEDEDDDAEEEMDGDKNSGEDTIDWNALDPDGHHVLSLAAGAGMLLEVWQLVRDSVIESLGLESIPMRHPIAALDWTALGPDQAYFECFSGLQDTTWGLYQACTVPAAESPSSQHSSVEALPVLGASDGVVALCVKKPYMRDALLFTAIKNARVDAVELLMASKQTAVDFEGTDDHSRTAFHLVCELADSPTVQKRMLSAMVSRIEEKRAGDTRPSCMAEDEDGNNVLSLAAQRRCLNVMWAGLCTMEDFKCLTHANAIKIRGGVYEEDFDRIPLMDQRRFKCERIPAAVANDFTSALYHATTVAALEALLAKGGNLSERKPHLTESPLHRFVALRDGALLEACMRWDQPIDFTVRDPHGKTPLHYAMEPWEPSADGKSERILKILVDRIKSHPTDVVDWDQQDDVGNDVLSLAAKHDAVHVVWPMLRDLPPYCDRQGTWEIRVRIPILRSDIEQLGNHEKTRFSGDYLSRTGKNRADDFFHGGRVDGHGTIQWRRHKELGTGGFAVVYLGELPNGCMAAVKCSKKGQYKISEEEALQQCKLAHRNVVTCYGYQHGLKMDQLQIFLEWCPHSLDSLLKENPTMFTMPVVRKYTRHILQGLAYLHSTGVLHRDVKPENVLVSTDYVGKLTDFNASRDLLREKRKCDATNVAAEPVDAATREMRARERQILLQLLEEDSCLDGMTVTLAKTGQRGTEWYMAPEVHRGDCVYSVGSDIWSLGCTVLEMLGFHPRKHGMMIALMKDDRDADAGEDDEMPAGRELREHCPPALYAFLRRCLALEPSQRWTAAKLLADDEWLNCPTVSMEALR